MQPITVIPEKPAEKGTAVFKIFYTDDDGTNVIPTDCAWQLMKSIGTIIGTAPDELSFANGRFTCDDTFVNGAGDTVTGKILTIYGDSLAIFGGADDGERVLSVQGTYSSDAESDLPVKAEAEFTIQRLLGQVDET